MPQRLDRIYFGRGPGFCSLRVGHGRRSAVARKHDGHSRRLDWRQVDESSGPDEALRRPHRRSSHGQDIRRDRPAPDAGRPAARRVGRSEHPRTEADDAARARPRRDRGPRGPHVHVLRLGRGRPEGLDRRARPRRHPVPEPLGPDDQRRAVPRPARRHRRLLLGRVLPDQPAARRTRGQQRRPAPVALRRERAPRAARARELPRRARPDRASAGGRQRLRRPVRDQGPGPRPLRPDRPDAGAGPDRPDLPLHEQDVHAPRRRSRCRPRRPGSTPTASPGPSTCRHAAPGPASCTSRSSSARASSSRCMPASATSSHPRPTIRSRPGSPGCRGSSPTRTCSARWSIGAHAT